MLTKLKISLKFIILIRFFFLRARNSSSFNLELRVLENDSNNFLLNLHKIDLLILVVGGKVTQTMRPVTATTTSTTTTSASPVQQPPQKVIIRSVPTKTIISANNVVKIAPEPPKVKI